MFRKMLIVGFICFLSLTFLGRVEANQYSLRVLDSRGSSENVIPVAYAHVDIGANAGGQEVFSGETDSQGFIWFNASFLQHLFYEISKPPCYNTITGQITAGVTQAVIMPWNGSCQSPQDTTITAKDGRFGPPYVTPVIGATVTGLPGSANCQNGCVTDALGKVYFQLTEPATFTITAAGFNTFNGNAQPGHDTEAVLQHVPNPVNTWITAWNARTITMLTGCHFVIKRCPTLETMYDCTYPNCGFAVDNWSFADGGATLKVYLDTDANYIVSKSGFFSAANGCFNGPLRPGEHRDALLEPISYPQGGEGCFLAGTPILMADKSAKPIEKVMPGDKILSYDEKAKTTMKEKVRVFMMQESDGYVLINGRIKATGDHPFYVEGKWIFARDLKAGDQLLGIDGKPEAVKSIKIFNKKVLVYNFEAVPSHTYFAAGVLVHNRPGKVQNYQDEPIEP